MNYKTLFQGRFIYPRFCGAKIRAACEEISFILKIKEEKSLWN